MKLEEKQKICKEFIDKSIAKGNSMSVVSLKSSNIGEDDTATISLSVSVVKGDLDAFNAVCDEIYTLVTRCEHGFSVRPYDEYNKTILEIEFNFTEGN